jgi:hypothetical protein
MADDGGAAAGGGSDASRIAWIKKGVCEGLNLETKYFDDLVQHPVDGPQLKAFLKEEALTAETWLLFYAATELEGVEEEEEEEEEAAPAAPQDDARLAELAAAIKDAAKKGDADKVGALLAEGVPVDVQDDAGYTPLVSSRAPPPPFPRLSPAHRAPARPGYLLRLLCARTDRRGSRRARSTVRRCTTRPQS